MNHAFCQSPIGLIEIAGTESAVTSLYFVDQGQADSLSNSVSNPLLDEALRQLNDYFAGERRNFDLPLAMTGTDFQRRVWAQLLTIPYGQSASYQEIADALGNSKAVRAVGAANGQNPISLIVPCHRIIGSSGKLIGYGGGLWRKEWLLRHEGALLI